MSRTHIVAFVCTVMIASPTQGFGQATVVSGSVTSVAAFVQLQANIRGKIEPGKQASFASCVCAKNRSKIVYAYSLQSTADNNLTSACKKAAAKCGGCFKAPAFAQLKSQADVDRAQQAQRTKRTYQTVLGDGEAAPERQVRDFTPPPPPPPDP